MASGSVTTGSTRLRPLRSRLRPRRAVGVPTRPPPPRAPDRPAHGPGGEPGTVSKRLDLQGLRAVAVLLVALDHANVPLLSGGYVGVDVFFVLSGYFITGVMLREAFGRDGRTLGRISIRGFYARRVRRILPAASLALVVTSLAVYVVYDLMRADYLQTKPVLEDGLAASLFFANIHFAATATNYFAQASATMPSPFQHFWSLSVEEQFYFFWPTLLACTLFLCRGHGERRQAGEAERRLRRATWAIGLLIATACALSLLWSIHYTSVNPQAAYFSTPARVWELGCGAGLALLAARSRRQWPQLPRVLLGWAGLSMIAVATVLYTSQTPFPGDAAALPVIGSALIIFAGFGPARAGVGGLLAIRPMAYIGDRSYTFYLWHFPALILPWELAGHVLPVGVNLALLAGGFALSVITYRLYENPLRFSSLLRGWRTAVIAPLMVAMGVTAALVPAAIFEGALAAQALAATRAKVVTLVPASGQPAPAALWGAKPIPEVAVATRLARNDSPLPSAIVPSLSLLEQENSFISYDIPAGCQASFGSGDTSRVCKLGTPSSKTVVAVLGDSHAGMWMPALIADARAQGFAVVPLDKPGCFLNRVDENLPGWPCATWYRWALRQDHKLHPVATLVTFELPAVFQAHPISTADDLQAVLAQVTHGVLLADPPGQAERPATCLVKPGATMGSCSTAVPATYPRLMAALSQMAVRTHHLTLPTAQWFCGDGLCPMVVDNTLTTRDGSHLTMEYSADLAPLVGLEMKRILTRLETRQERERRRIAARLPLGPLGGRSLAETLTLVTLPF